MAEDDLRASLRFGFRRRCAWCGVSLRGWQLNLCRRCKRAVKWDEPSPPVGRASRWEATPDRAARVEAGEA